MQRRKGTGRSSSPGKAGRGTFPHMEFFGVHSPGHDKGRLRREETADAVCGGNKICERFSHRGEGVQNREYVRVEAQKARHSNRGTPSGSSLGWGGGQEATTSGSDISISLAHDQSSVVEGPRMEGAARHGTSWRYGTQGSDTLGQYARGSGCDQPLNYVPGICLAAVTPEDKDENVSTQKNQGKAIFEGSLNVDIQERFFRIDESDHRVDSFFDNGETLKGSRERFARSTSLARTEEGIPSGIPLIRRVTSSEGAGNAMSADNSAAMKDSE